MGCYSYNRKTKRKCYQMLSWTWILSLQVVQNRPILHPSILNSHCNMKVTMTFIVSQAVTFLSRASNDETYVGLGCS